MKKADFSKTIGFVNRCGVYSPTNERSAEKLQSVLKKYACEFMMNGCIDSVRFGYIRQFIKDEGMKAAIFNRGIC